MMIFANLHSAQEYWPIGCLFMDEKELAEAVLDPECEGVTDILRFVVHGDCYKERKQCVRDLALAFQNADQGGLSYVEIAAVEDFFRKNGKRYGLMDEFEANCIC